MIRVPHARLTMPALLIAAVIGAGIPATLLYRESLATEAADGNRAQASAAAKVRLERILSYRFGSVDEDLVEAKAATTGEFGRQFATTADEIIAPAARQAEITTSATVVSTAVISASPGDVVVLAFVNQATTTKDKPQPSTNALRLRVTLDRAGGPGQHAGREGGDYAHHGRAGNPLADFVPDGIIDRFCLLGPASSALPARRDPPDPPRPRT